MSSTLNDTMKTAIHGVESVREGTERTFADTVATLVKGVNAVSGVVAVLRSFNRDTGLGWLGLARRHPFRSGTMFGAGVALGAGLGLLFAPMSGADLRGAILGGSRKQEPEAKPAKPPAKEDTHEKDLGYGASHGYDQTHGGPTGPGDAPAPLKEEPAPGGNPRPPVELASAPSR